MFTQRNLRDQRALVTSATSGIGRAVVLRSAQHGGEVVVHGRNAERGAETVREITVAAGRGSFVAADLTDPADVQWLADEVGDDVEILKASLEAMTRAWVTEYGASGVRVSTIAPGLPTPRRPQARNPSRRSEKPRRCTALRSPRRSPRSSPPRVAASELHHRDHRRSRRRT
jgi:NAD(P)-dependent dehydrogenase (short-subunit alcohol dehydrogenase family)